MRWLLACLALTMTVAGCLALAAAAVGQGDAKKGEPDKGTAPAKGKDKDKDKDVSKGKADKPSLPPGTIIMTADDLQKALPGWPRMIWMPLAELQALKDRLAALERQVKGD